jgi:hypothetical protein
MNTAVIGVNDFTMSAYGYKRTLVGSIELSIESITKQNN